MLDPHCFKAFQIAAQTLNFTEAARLAGMTQSGISQHISKLEQGLGTALFTRIGKKALLTPSGEKLLKFIDAYHDSLTEIVDEIQDLNSSLKGKVRYSMPSSCLISPHFSLLLTEKAKKFPEVDLEVNLNASNEVVRQVMNGEVDFGFVTQKIPNDDLTYTEFCDEEFVLVSSKHQTPLAADLSDQKWIEYPGSALLLERWQNHSRKEFSPKFSGKTNSMHAALIMVAHDLGVAIVPRHCVESSEVSKKLIIHPIRKKEPCLNMIYIVQLKTQTQPKRVTAVIDSFLEMKSS
jgi:DNA-binding transcriptional LysR family regulator